MILLYQDPENESSEDHPQQVAEHGLELKEQHPKPVEVEITSGHETNGKSPSVDTSHVDSLEKDSTTL